jgi:Mor family transcriptional regulator
MQFTDFKPLDISLTKADELATVALALDSAAPEAWVTVAELAYLVLRASPDLAKVTPTALGLCAAQISYQIAHEIGGQPLYFPKGLRPVKEEKAKAIVAGFTGDNTQELARKHGITGMRVRQILNAHTARAKAQKGSKAA